MSVKSSNYMKRCNMFYILLISLVSAMGGLLFGYDWVVIGGAKIFYEPFFGLDGLPSMRGWAMSCALVGCLTGALLAGMWSDRYGRKKMLLLASVLFTVSAIGVGMADRISGFIIYRIVGGFGIGIASNISPIYIAEVAPAPIRGRFVSLNQLTIVLGILAAQVANWAIARYFSIGGEMLNPRSLEWAWRWMFWVGALPAMLFFVASFVIPESPRWLALNGKTEAARRIFIASAERSMLPMRCRILRDFGMNGTSGCRCGRLSILRCGGCWCSVSCWPSSSSGAASMSSSTMRTRFSRLPVTPFPTC